MTDPQPNNPWQWNRSNVSALVVVVTLLIGLVGYRTLSRRGRVSERLVVTHSDLPAGGETIDLNAAAWPELVRLPGVGETRARAIVRYRERFQAEHPGRVAFTCIDDVQNVDDIGPGIAERIEPYVVFPSTVPTSLPALTPAETALE